MAIKKWPEIYSWKENELKSRFENDNYSWEEVKSRLDEIEINEQVDIELNRLEWNIESYYNYLRWLINEQQTENLNKKDSLAQKWKNKVIYAWEKAFLNEAEKLKKIPILWNALYWVAEDIASKTKESLEPKKDEWFFEKFSREIKIWVGIFILWLFWIKWIKDKISWKWLNKDQIDNLTNTTSNSFQNSSANIQNNSLENSQNSSQNQNLNQNVKNDLSKNLDNNNSNISEADEENENLNDKIPFSYKAGFELLFSLSRVKAEENIGKEVIVSGLSDITYEDFLENWNEVSFKNKVLWNESWNEDYKKQYLKIEEWFKSKNVKDLLRIGLKPEILKNILEKNSEKLLAQFWQERYDFILNMINSWNFDYKKLTFKELSILYIYTFPAVWNVEVLAAFEGSKVLLWDFTEFVWEKNVFENSKNKFSKNLVQAVLTKSWGKENLDKSLEQMILKLGLEEQKDKNDFEKIYNFKNYVFTEYLNNPKNNFSQGQKNSMKEKMNYKWILTLYSLTWGKKLEEINDLNLPLIIFLNKEILASWQSVSDKIEASNYLKNYVSRAFWEKNFLSDDQKRVFEIFWKKVFMDVLLLNHINWVAETLWLLVDKEKIPFYAAWGFVGWWAMVKAWRKIETNALKNFKMPIIWSAIKKLWRVWVLFWMISWGYALASKSWKTDLEKLDQDLSTSYENEDISWFIKTLEEHSNSIKNYERREKNSVEKWKIIAYKDSHPYIIYKWMPYSIEVLDVSWKGFLGKLTWATLDGLFPKEASLNWKDISNIKIDGENIVLWNNVYRLPINTFLSGNWENKRIGTNFTWRIDQAIKDYISEDRSFIWNHKKLDIIDTWVNIWNDFTIGLVPLQFE